jgi:hypothetical protein
VTCKGAGLVQLAALPAAVLVLMVAALPVHAADEQAIVQQMTALNQSAIEAYSDGDVDRAKSDLRKAVSLGEANNLADHPVMARTYLHLGIMHVDWFEDVAAGKRYFRRALEIAPDMRLTSALATKSAKAAFGEARAQIGVAAVATGDRMDADRANELRQRISLLERERQERERQAADAKRRLDQLESERQEKDRQLADARQRLMQIERTRHGRDRPLRERRAKSESTARQP